MSTDTTVDTTTQETSWDRLKKLVEEAEVDYFKLRDKGVQDRARTLRKKMQDLRKLAKEVRKESLELRKVAKERRAQAKTTNS